MHCNAKHVLCDLLSTNQGNSSELAGTIKRNLKNLTMIGCRDADNNWKTSVK